MIKISEMVKKVDFDQRGVLNIEINGLRCVCFVCDFILSFLFLF